MGDKAFMRYRTRDRIAHRLIGHITGERRPKHTQAPPDGTPAVVAFDDTGTMLLDRNPGDREQRIGAIGTRRIADAFKAAVERDKGARAERKMRGRKPFPLVDAVFTGPPGWDMKESWSPALVARWAQDTARWLVARVKAASPKARVWIVAHADESAPHLHALICPSLGNGTISWGKLLVGMSADERASEQDPGKEGVSAAMSVLQDRYHAEVAHTFGLERGEKGSKRVHRQANPELSAVKREAAAEEARNAVSVSLLRKMASSGHAAQAQAARAELAGRGEPTHDPLSSDLSRG